MSNAQPSYGIGPATGLFFIFLVLKLTGYIAWDWVWVTAPLWVPLVVAATIVLIVCLVALFTPYRKNGQ